MKYIDWGLIDYNVALNKQQDIVFSLLSQKENNIETESTWIICEHFPVITIGKNGKKENILLSNSILEKKGIECVHIDRGGDATFHGPGQIVCYPILNLESYLIGIKEYVFRIEQIIIETLNDFGIKGERKKGAAGVWIDPEKENERKICAIGIKCSRYVTMHGLALNVNTDLSFFDYIKIGRAHV